MDIYDNESEIIRAFQNIAPSSVMFAPECTSESEALYWSIKDATQWVRWCNSSGKADPPPDFYSDFYGFMMDVMRVDDHGYISSKGKTVNPTRKRESEVARELSDKGVLSAFPNAKLIMTVDTQLPTHEDHNYDYYRDNFVRTIESHKIKIPNYKANHPNLKTVFFVFDESSQYMQVSKKISNPRVGTSVMAMPHLWWTDAEFISSVTNSDIDFVIWFTPYKHCEMYEQDRKPVTMPVVTIIDTKQIIDTFEYTRDLMESVEI